MSYILTYGFYLSALSLLLYLSGSLVERLLLRHGESSRAEIYLRPASQAVSVPITRIALGMGLWICLVFVLAATSVLHPTAVYVSVAVVVVAVLALYLRAGSRPRLVIPPLTKGFRLTEAALTAGLLFLLGLLFVEALGPNVSWDANTYHLTLPRLYLESHGFRRIPFNVYSNWPLNIELLFGLTMVFKDYILAKLLHFLCGLLTLVVIYRIVRAETSPRAGLWAAALLLLNDVVLFEMRVAYVDLAFALFFVLAFAHLHEALEHKERATMHLVFAGVFCGLLAGIKLSGLFGVISLAGLVVVEKLRQKDRGLRLAPGLTFLLGPTALLLAPWLVRSLLYTGNPVYPFLYGLFGGPEWSRELHTLYVRWQQAIGMGRSALDYLLLPVRVILEGASGYQSFDGRIHALWIVLVPLSLAFSFRCALIRRCLWTALFYFGLWSLSSQQMRFLIPVLPLLAIAAAVSIFRLLAWIRGRQPRVVAEALLSMTLLALLLMTSASRLPRSQILLRSYQEHGQEVRELAVHPVYRFINQNLPSDARIMMLNTNHGFFCERDYVADSFFEASQMSALLSTHPTKDGVRQTLREHRISHLLIENRDWRIPYPDGLVELLDDSRLAQLLYQSPDGRYRVVSIN